MSISAPFIRKPIATSLLMAGVLLVGLVAYPLLPVAPLPQVDFPTIQISAQLPGADPTTMASSVTAPLERQFAEIPGVSQMTSSSTLGNSSITLQFDLDRNIDAAAGDVQTAINAAGGQLPKDLPSPPTYRKVNPADAPILVIAARSDTLPLTAVDDYAENVLSQNISQVPGVAQVSIGGQQKPSVRVQVDPQKLAALGIGLEDVRGVIANATADSPKGSIDGATRTFTIYDNDQELKAEPWNDVIIAYKNGAPVRIRDIGQAVEGPENTKLAAWSGGQRAVLLIVFKQPGANVIDVVDHVKALLPQLQAAIPPAVKVDILSDRTTTIRASVSDVQFTLLLTICLVVMVIFVFLRNFWATAIPSVTVPLALVGTLALMYAFGYSLDNLSLMGLSIAVGFVVDDAIVMLENIHRHIEAGLSPVQAALKGAGEIGFTIFSISLSLVAVFIPLLLMGGIVGRVFREFAVTVSMTILVSAIVSLTLTPVMCAKFMKHDTGQHGRLYRISERGFDLLLAGYRRSLDAALMHRRITLMVFLATVAATAYLFVIIPKGFFPQQDTGLILGTSEAAQDISFAEMSRKQVELGKIVAADPDVATLAMALGSSGGQTLNNGRLFITLKPRDERQASASQIIDRLRPQLAKVEGAALFLQPAQDINIGGRATRTLYQYTLQDANIDELNQWAPRIYDKLKTLPQLRDVATDEQTGGTTLTLDIDRDAAARYGIQPQLIDDTLYDASLASEPYLVAAALIVIYIILGVLYESYIHPLTILSTLPSAGAGALVMLMLFGFDFSVIALIGVILLIGIVKKNGIMMVDFAIQAERDQGMTPYDAIRQACLLRFRPIMMTTMAALLGGLPLMLGSGTGAELRQPLGYAMVGGLILSQALTLYTTPVVYLYLDKLRVWLASRRRPDTAMAPHLAREGAPAGE
ncbi:MAG: efflux RND transporter permease subunit [Inquilinus limosus]|uniref:Efflux RND transporter permease subunit n=1 Tax=Inquilinus limosus TaxID=171674 RepID=A0A952FHW5_9PROT|nr:efflux RND transporter permease subunit [Inquilinus limosus]